MKRHVLALLILALVVVVGRAIAAPSSVEFDCALSEYEEGQQLRTDQPDRARQLFRSAARRLEELAGPGLSNGFLEYNLGNCFLQAGDVGRAILHYRRAERLIPRDALLADNLSVARSRCLLNIAPTRSAAVLRSVFLWHHETSLPARAMAALAAYALFWLLLTVRAAVPRPLPLIAAAVAGLVAAASGGSYAAQQWLDRNAPDAVVIATDVAVYKGPATTYQRQFEQPLQPGVEVTVRERRGGWMNIELPDGKRGWVESEAIETVPKNENNGESAILPT